MRRMAAWLAPMAAVWCAVWCAVLASVPVMAQDAALPSPGTPPTDAEQYLPGDGWHKLPPVAPGEWAAVQGGAAGASTAQFSGPSWTCMVFDSLRDGNWEVYASSGGDPAPRRLTRSAQPDVDAAVNRGCTAVAYVSYRGDDDTATIFRMGIDGSGSTALTDAHTPNYDPKWSPDGKQIVFTSMRTGNSDIFVMDADGGNVRRLTEWGAGDFDPSWSPDGRQIVWVRQVGKEHGVLAVRNADGSGGETALTGLLRYPQHPMFSPEGNEIGFDYDHDGDSWNDAAICHVRSTPENPIIRTVTQGGQYVEKWFDAWSPVEPELGGQRGMVVSTLQYKISGRNLVLNYTQLIEVPSNTALHSSEADLRADLSSTDTAAPAASMERLADYYMFTEPVELRWSAQDTGPSGLHHYEVEYKLDHWDIPTSQTTKTWYPFAAGSDTVRVRGVDGASNRSPWAERPLVVLARLVSGHIYDNRGYPLPEIRVNIGWEPSRVVKTDAQGYYEARFEQEPEGGVFLGSQELPWGLYPYQLGDPGPRRATLDGYYVELNFNHESGLRNHQFGYTPPDAMWTTAGDEIMVGEIAERTGGVQFGGTATPDSAIDHLSSVAQSIDWSYDWDAKRNSTLSFFYSMTVAAPTQSVLRAVLIDHETLSRTEVFSTSQPTDGWQYQWVDISMQPTKAFTVSLEYWHPAGQGPIHVWVTTIDVAPWNTPVVTALPTGRIEAGIPLTIAVEGRNFAPGVMVKAEPGGVCAVVRSGGEQLECFFAKGLAAGLHRLVVTNPTGHYTIAPTVLRAGNLTYLPDLRRER
jgi:hypothetical protein